MNSSVNDSVLAEFSSITGASSADAKKYLEAANFILEEAIDLFFAADVTNNATNTTTVDNNQSFLSEMHDINNQFLKEEENGIIDDISTRAKVKNADIYDEDGIRLPDAVKRQRLVDYSPSSNS